MADLAFRSQTNGGDNSTTVNTVNAGLPAGTVSGDWCTIWVGVGVAAPGTPPAISTPAGWDARGTSATIALAAGAFNVRVTLLTKVAGGSEGAVTLATVGGVNAAITFVRKSYQNPDASTPFGQVTFATATGGPGTSAVVSSLTTTEANALVDAFIAQGTAQGCTPPGSMTERADNATLGISSADEIIPTAGATGTRTFTLPTSADYAWGFAEFHSANLATITAQPVDQTVNAGATATFTVTATGATGYQWQDDSGGSFADISGATSSSYTTGAAAYTAQGRQYRCNVSNANGTATSSAAKLLVAFNMVGTGPSAVSILGGGPFGAGAFGEWSRGVATGGGAGAVATSLQAAVQAALSASSSVSAAVQVQAASQTSLGAAVASLSTAVGALSSAVQAARAATASIGAAVQGQGAASASLAAAVQLGATAAASVQAAIQAASAATVGLSAQVQVPGVTTSTAALNAAVQASAAATSSLSAALQIAQAAAASVSAAVQVGRTLPASLGAAVQVAGAASASLGAALQAATVAAAGLNAQVQAGTSAAASLDAAVQAGRAAVASLNAAVATAQVSSLSLGAAVAAQTQAAASLQSAVMLAAFGAAGVSAYIEDPSVVVYTGQSRGRVGATPMHAASVAIGAAVQPLATQRVGDEVAGVAPQRIGGPVQ